MSAAIHDARVYHKQLFLGADSFDPAQQWKVASALCAYQELGTSQGEELGFGESWLSEQGFFWVLVRLRTVLSLQPTIGFIRGETWKQAETGVLWRRDYRLSSLENRELSAAVGMWALLDRQSRRVLRPEHHPHGYPLVADRMALPQTPRKLPHRRIASPDLLTRHRVSYADLDANGHTHNARYAEWLCDALPYDLLCEHRVGTLQIDFISETKHGQEILLCGEALSPDRRRWSFSAKSGEELCFLADMELIPVIEER